MSAQIETALQRRWIWLPSWRDESRESAASLVRFTRTFDWQRPSTPLVLYITADTRYKLWINGFNAAVGPTRSCERIWYYDTIDIGRHLRSGANEIVVEVLRFFPGNRCGFQFARTRQPGLTIYCEKAPSDNGAEVDLSTDAEGWSGQIAPVQYGFGRSEDFFLHVFEQPSSPGIREVPALLNIHTQTGELSPWNLRARLTPQPTQSCLTFSAIRSATGRRGRWESFIKGEAISLEPGNHTVVLSAEHYTTAFLTCRFKASPGSTLVVKYAECFERLPKEYPWIRDKGNRLGDGLLLGPSDVINLGEGTCYEPFWYRSFRFVELQISVGEQGLVLEAIDLRQTSYPFEPGAIWKSSSSVSERIWEVSLRTLRNCVYDGYSDCPFYEQLQYAEDTRSSGLFHYLLSGDDRLMRQAIDGFAVSWVADGLTQARYPSHVPQVIPGFSLFWVLQVCDHHLYFADNQYARSLLPVIDLVFGFFRRHVDTRGLVSGVPAKFWQFVDWSEEWKATADHSEGGVPLAGRKSNTHTFSSLLLAYTAQAVARLANDLGHTYVQASYALFAKQLVAAVQEHCFDGEFFLDSIKGSEMTESCSQHVQIFAVLTGAIRGPAARHNILESARSARFVKCSYVFTHYAFRAYALAGVYDTLWNESWAPWKRMLDLNLSTWEEDIVTQRSDCHAWGSVAIYEYLVEVAGVRPAAPGWTEIYFEPRLNLLESVSCRVMMGSGGKWADVSWVWGKASCKVAIKLNVPVRVWSRDLDGKLNDRGVVQDFSFEALR